MAEKYNLLFYYNFLYVPRSIRIYIRLSILPITSIFVYLHMNLGNTQLRSAVHVLLFGLNENKVHFD